MTIRKNLIYLTLGFVLLGSWAGATTVEEEIVRVADKVSRLELGFDEYILGRTLNKAQKAIAPTNIVEDSLEGTYKFKDQEIFVVAAEDTDIILGVYKQFSDLSMDEIKKVVGALMLEYGEPTASAHDKMIYWTYNDSGKIDQDTFEFEKDNGGTPSLAAIKFSSSERLESEPPQERGDISAYLMITSDPLSKLFLSKIKK